MRLLTQVAIFETSFDRVEIDVAPVVVAPDRRELGRSPRIHGPKHRRDWRFQEAQVDIGQIA